MLTSLFGLGSVLILVFLRMPIAIAMGLVGFIGYAEMRGTRASISMVGRLVIDTAQDYGLSVVPLFILMGLFVNKGGLSRELYQVSGVAETVNMDHIKYHYFASHRSINPTGIVPNGPEIDFMQAHGRDSIS